MRDTFGDQHRPRDRFSQNMGDFKAPKSIYEAALTKRRHASRPPPSDRLLQDMGDLKAKKLLYEEAQAKMCDALHDQQTLTFINNTVLLLQKIIDLKAAQSITERGAGR